MDRLLSIAVLFALQLCGFLMPCAAEEPPVSWESLRTQWADTSGMRALYCTFSQYDGETEARIAYFEFSRDGLLRQLTRREAPLGRPLDPESIQVLSNRDLRKEALALASRGRVSVDTFDGIRQRTFRPQGEERYECVVLAEPFPAHVTPRIWRGSLIHAQEPLWRVVRDGLPLELDLEGGQSVLAASWKGAAVLLGFDAGSDRHSEYLFLNTAQSAVVDSLRSGATLESLGRGPDVLGYSKIYGRDEQTGLPALVKSRFPSVSLTEWHVLLSVSKLEDFDVVEIPPVLSDERIFIVDEVTRRAFRYERGELTDITPDAEPLAAGDADGVNTERDRRMPASTLVCLVLGGLLIIAAVLVRRSRMT